MGYVIRNSLRRKGRAVLTVLGVAIGIFALTVIGAMSEYFGTTADDAEVYYRNRPIVKAEKGYNLSTAIARRIQRIPGVRLAVPTVSGPLDDVPSIGIASMFDGIPAGVELDPPGVSLLKGRHLRPGDNYHALVGYTVAETRNVDIGDTIAILDHDFIVVGIWERSGRAYDRFAQISLATAQAILNQPDYIDSITVVVEEGENVNAVVDQILYNVPRIEVKRPEELVASMREAALLLSLTLASGSLLAAVIGGLFITNTMLMAVNERVQEIGLKKAIGASNGDIILEYVGEAVAFSLAGWAIGGCCSWIVTSLMNAGIQAQWGLTIFILTPRLVLLTWVFATVLGALGGLYPAWRATRLDPAIALRSL
jgi:putative ABC transport system permease protein